MKKKKEIKARSAKELDLLIDLTGSLLRRKGIWVLPDNIRELKDGTIKLCFVIFPAGEGDKVNLPTQNLVRCKRLNERDSAYFIYRISEEELKEYE